MLNRTSNVTAMHTVTIVYYYGVLLLLAAVTNTDSTKCNRLIDGTTAPRSNADGKYYFFITLYNRTDRAYAYMPSTRYSVILQADSSEELHRKFTRFIISAEAENATETSDVGVFDLQDDALIKYADTCANAVMETSKVSKEEISVAWTSPPEDSGCILIRATVMETLDTWYMDDSNLVFTMCQDLKAEADDQGRVLDECCACDEAKYEVTFEGLWSRNTHPKDFPSKAWLTRFSDVIGASHTGDYHFWQYSGMASTGLRQVAELGATRKLESELKDQSEHIRTIIKARGISYPNVTSKTFAVFRVDRKHHLMSLVSMIVPSPDWVVGVSGLELCLTNCSWIEHKELNLYPYDVGTDDGITYLSPDSPTEPQEPIRRITSMYPNDSRSPFYDSSGLDMKPFAKLYLNRQRLYEITCDEAGETQADTGVVESNRENKVCSVTSWGEWGPCSVTCGRGYRLKQRRFRDETAANANKCTTPLTDRSFCFNAQSPPCALSTRYDGILNSSMCELTEWSEWSSCSSTCGEGSRTRSRNYLQKIYGKQCRAASNAPILQQSIECENEPCEGEDAEEVRIRSDETEYYDIGDYDAAYGTGEMIEQWLQKCPKGRYSEWSMWSPCTSSCGPGFKLRSRSVNENWTTLGKEDDIREECKVQQASCVAQIANCDFTKEEAEKICNEPMVKGRCNNNILRAYFDKQTGRCRMFKYSGCDGNRNNFATKQDCNNVCGNLQKNQDFKGIQTGSQIMESNKNETTVDCQVSEWTTWSHCENCRGYTTSIREITIPANGKGAKKCPKKLVRRKKCRKILPCSLQSDGTGRRFYRDKNSGMNCKVTPWSTWSRCSATCGEALRSRVRSVIVKPQGLWAKLCPVLAESRKCPTIRCPQ